MPFLGVHVAHLSEIFNPIQDGGGFVPRASPKLLNFNQDHPSKKAIFLVKS